MNFLGFGSRNRSKSDVGSDSKKNSNTSPSPLSNTVKNSAPNKLLTQDNLPSAPDIQTPPHLQRVSNLPLPSWESEFGYRQQQRQQSRNHNDNIKLDEPPHHHQPQRVVSVDLRPLPRTNNTLSTAARPRSWFPNSQMAQTMQDLNKKPFFENVHELDGIAKADGDRNINAPQQLLIAELHSNHVPAVHHGNDPVPPSLIPGPHNHSRAASEPRVKDIRRRTLPAQHTLAPFGLSHNWGTSSGSTSTESLVDNTPTTALLSSPGPLRDLAPKSVRSYPDPQTRSRSSSQERKAPPVNQLPPLLRIVRPIPTTSALPTRPPPGMLSSTRPEPHRDPPDPPTQNIYVPPPPPSPPHPPASPPPENPTPLDVNDHQRLPQTRTNRRSFSPPSRPPPSAPPLPPKPERYASQNRSRNTTPAQLAALINSLPPVGVTSRRSSVSTLNDNPVSQSDMIVHPPTTPSRQIAKDNSNDNNTNPPAPSRQITKDNNDPPVSSRRIEKEKYSPLPIDSRLPIQDYYGFDSEGQTAKRCPALLRWKPVGNTAVTCKALDSPPMSPIV
jgi:hypothetical protein